MQIKSSSTWRAILRQNFSQLDLLADFLQLSDEQRSQCVIRSAFPLQVPLRLAQKMAKGTLDDPLVKQFIPLRQELEATSGFVLDPVCDSSFQEEGKLLRKYQGRVLLVCTSACAMHCRYCFRQNFDYSLKKGFEKELAAIQDDPSIHEVILSGGDPLSFSDEVLADLLEQVSAIPHIRRLRFHTRFPIGIPERIDDSFLHLIASLPQRIYFVIHSNHPAELDQDIFDGLRRLQQLGCVVLNQAVLLKGVNDDAATLCELAEKLVDHGILFYYLHQLDRVKGAAHFEVDEQRGKALIEKMAENLPGYAVPKYVREIAGEAHKTPL
ncbi:MAG: KamA family radical SAM protein [Parachlamydiaceae bacterium]